MAKVDELKIEVIGTGVVQEAMIDMANTLHKEFGVRLDSVILSWNMFGKVESCSVSTTCLSKNSVTQDEQILNYFD